jgi:hypothetical protein
MANMAVTCPNGHENDDGAFFCEICGAALTDATTTPLARLCAICGQPNQPDATVCAYCDSPLESAEADLAGQIVRLEVMNSEIIYDITGKDDVLIGRADLTEDHQPDVDLGLVGNEQLGVSRRHAIIHRVGGHFTIEDLQSINHTFLNKQHLEPHVPTTLRSGDELRLGRVALRFRIG